MGNDNNPICRLKKPRWFDFNRLYTNFRKIKLKSGIGGIAHGQYIAPNEHHDHLYARCIQRKPLGGIVGVGTFRMLNRLVHGNYPFLIMFDYDYGVAAFNRFLIKLIKIAKNRREFLSILFTGGIKREHIEMAKLNKWSSVRFIQQLAYPDAKHPILKLNFYDDCEKLLRGNINARIKGWQHFGLGRGFKSYSNKSKDLIVSLLLKNKAFSDNKKDILHINTGFDLVRLISKSRYFLTEPISKMSSSVGFRLSLGDYHRSRSFHNTFAGSDRLYKMVRQKAISGRIKVVVGDLTSPKHMRSIGEILRTHRYYISAVDISNVPDYLNRSMRIRMAEGIRQLPLTVGARLFFTTNMFANRFFIYFRNDGWFYGVALASDAKRVVDYWQDKKDQKAEFMVKKARVRLYTRKDGSNTNLQPYPYNLCR